MGRAPLKGWTAAVALVSATMATTIACALGAAASEAVSSGNDVAHPTLARLGHAAFWGCPSKTTELFVAVNTLTLHPGATLHISFAVRNGGAEACTYTAPFAGGVPGPTTTSLQAGPCGSVDYEIIGANHRNVWPGPRVVNCPALGPAKLAPGADVSGSGAWNQTEPDSSKRVPAGSYTLVVEHSRFSFPLHVLRS